MIKLLILIALTSLGNCFQWRSWTAGNGIPSGHYNGKTYYVIRAYYQNGLLPGKYSPDENYAYLSIGGYEVYVKDIQVSDFQH
jgi:hypothetical protein